MAYSYVIIEFISMPAVDDYLGIDEEISLLGLNEIFKTDRTQFIETEIPKLSNGRYEMTIPNLSGTDNLGIDYTDEFGVFRRLPLSSVPVMDRPDGSYTYTIISQGPVVFYDLTTLESIAWSGGSFENMGSYYNGYISRNYRNALDLDYNQTGRFTIEDTDGAIGSGLGTVKITANFVNAVFSAETYPFATITIHNEIVVPENSVTPDNLTFNLFTQVPEAEPQTINITANENTWSFIGDIPAWLSLSQLNGSSNTEVSITPIDFSEMIGTFSAVLLIKILEEIFSVNVTIIVKENVLNPFKKDKLYFTREKIFLKFKSDLDNTYFQINLEIKVFDINTNVESIFLRDYNLPLFQRKGEFFVGEIVEGLLNDIDSLKDFIPDFRSNYVKKQFRPAEIGISFSEKSYTNETEVSSGALDIFKMIKGYRPFMTSGELALLTVAQQEITRISPLSVIGTSFVYVGSPRIIMKVNNVVIEDFEVAESPNEIIYSYFRFNNNFKPGDLVEITISKDLETRSQRYLVFRNGLESTYFFFENQNGLIEPYEFTGRRRVLSNVKHTTTSRIKNKVVYEKKVLSTNAQSLIVNTGQLLKTDHRVILSIVRSENVWCSLDSSAGEYIMVDTTSNKFTNQDTNTSEEDFDVEFNILEDTDASIYPQ